MVARHEYRDEYIENTALREAVLAWKARSQDHTWNGLCRHAGYMMTVAQVERPDPSWLKRSLGINQTGHASIALERALLILEWISLDPVEIGL